MGKKMGLRTRFSNKIDHFKSKRSENSEVSESYSQISEEQDMIDVNLMEVGQFYWNLYADDPNFTPPADVKKYFDNIETSVNKINELQKSIIDRRASGLKEREQMDIEIIKQEEKNKQVREMRRSMRRI